MPIDWPTITLGAGTVSVRYDFGINYYLDKAKVKIADAWAIFTTGHVMQPGDYALTFDLFGAMVAHNFPEGHAPSGEYWARQVKSVDDYKAVVRAIAEALVKALPVAKQASAQPAMTETTPPPTLLPQ